MNSNSSGTAANVTWETFISQQLLTWQFIPKSWGDEGFVLISNGSPTAPILMAVGNGEQGEHGRGNANVWMSYDGINWFLPNPIFSVPGPTVRFQGGIFANNLWVLIGDGPIYTAPTGALGSWTFTPRTNPAPGTLNAIAYGNSTYVAVGEGGGCVTSPTGMTWTLRTTGASRFQGIAYGAGLFVAVGGGGRTPAIYTSPDGITWTSRSIRGLSDRLVAIAFANKLFVLTDGSSNVWTSSDGINWTKKASGPAYPPAIGALFSSIAYNGRVWLVVFSLNNGWVGTLMYSFDGVTWVTKYADALYCPFYVPGGDFPAGMNSLVADMLSGRFVCTDGAVVNVSLPAPSFP